MKDNTREVKINVYMLIISTFLEQNTYQLLSKSVKITLVKEKRQGSSSYANNNHKFGNGIVSIH